jgi:hypothetical protein
MGGRALKTTGSVLNMRTQNKIKSEHGIQAEMRCDLARVHNLLRLFSVHAESGAMEGGTSQSGAPVAKTMASAET